ncbi:MAG: Ribosomal small subunit pseudouridine synthase A [Hyphomicrobiaceae bacterium hypho_1]
MNKSYIASLRLDRLMGNLGYGTRKHIKALAKAGRIKLDGTPLNNAATKVAITKDLTSRLLIEGEKIDPLPGLVLLMNKPTGMTCSHKEEGAKVYDLLPSRWRARKIKISTVGRLDKNTSGLLLLTDNGVLSHKIIAPRHKLAKRYRVTLARPLIGHEADVFASGRLTLKGDNKPLLPALLEVDNSEYTGTTLVKQCTNTKPIVSLTIYEGRYHQIRRMFSALGNHVESLHRECLGGLVLPNNLKAANYRLLNDNDIAAIFCE